MTHISCAAGSLAVGALAYLHYINRETLILLAMASIIAGCFILAVKVSR